LGERQINQQLSQMSLLPNRCGLSLLVFVAATLSSPRLVGQTWEKITPASTVTPSPRYNATVVVDDIGRNLLVFGGRGDSGNLNELWSFNLDSRLWSNITPTATNQPAKRFAHNAVFDPQSRTMLIWSGQGAGFYNDLWAFDVDAGSWREIAPGGTIPNPRYGSASVFDPVRRRLVMFAGFTDAGRFQDTQAYDIASNTWIDMTPPGVKPVPRCLHTASYDPLLDRMLVYAGQRSGRLTIYGPLILPQTPGQVSPRR